MESEANKKTCLIITYGPVPTPQYQKIEGGGMRAWGLARGLLANDVDVTVAVNESFPQETTEIQGVKLINWAQDDAFINQFNSYDSVIMSYCMGDPSVFVAQHIDDKVQLILDVYVPIYVEVSARDTDNMPTEYSNYSQDIARHNQVLKRGDFFICANEVQKIFYTGVLGSLGVINPLSYRQDRIKILPFGIHDAEDESSAVDPYAELGISKTDKRVLWFGGMYPWFRTEELLKAIKTLAEKDSEYKFTFVGGKNPFNNNPDLLRQYEKTLQFSKDNGLFNKNMFFVDWVDYETRIDWYSHADFVISLNQPGDENAFAWRTRVMDYIWGGVVPLTNGGDPLGDELLNCGAAIKLKSLDSDEIIKTIDSVYADVASLKEYHKNLSQLRPKYYWNSITLDLSNIIKSQELPYKEEIQFLEKNNILPAEYATFTDQIEPTSRLTKAIRDPRKVISYAKQKGLRRSIRLGVGMVKNQGHRKVLGTKQYVFVGHPIDNTGAPLVLLQIIDELRKQSKTARIRLITPYIDEKIEKSLRKMNIKIEKSAQMSYKLTAIQLALTPNDFVFMNTLAVYDNYREVILNMAKVGRIKKLHWFIHEDEAQLKVVKPVLESPKVRHNISKLINDSKINVYVPSIRVKTFYDVFFDTKKVQAIPLHVDVPEKYIKEITPSSFDKLHFYLSGTPSDGRKGQLIALSAFQEYLLKYQAKNPSSYRDFTVNFISIGSDYISEQIRTIGTAVLGEKLNLYPSMPRNDALRIASECNVVMCCSLNETFGLYIAEGMLMGHIVLRNDSAGMEEQLVDGKNGYFIDSADIRQFAQQIEKLLNKKSSDEKLLKMGNYSKELMVTYKNNHYLDHIKTD